jgi:hypothetical protein
VRSAGAIWAGGTGRDRSAASSLQGVLGSRLLDAPNPPPDFDPLVRPCRCRAVWLGDDSRWAGRFSGGRSDGCSSWFHRTVRDHPCHRTPLLDAAGPLPISARSRADAAAQIRRSGLLAAEPRRCPLAVARLGLSRRRGGRGWLRSVDRARFPSRIRRDRRAPALWGSAPPGVGGQATVGCGTVDRWLT